MDGFSLAGLLLVGGLSLGVILLIPALAGLSWLVGHPRMRGLWFYTHEPDKEA